MPQSLIESEVRDDAVVLVTHFDAAPERVWREWTEPERFASWFGTPPATTPADRVRMDVRPGGRWAAVMVGEGGAEMPFSGAYHDVEAPVRLSFTMEDPADPSSGRIETATVDLAEEHGGTRMRFEQSGHLPSKQYPLLLSGYTLFFERLADDLRR